MAATGKYQRPGGALVRTSGDELQVWLVSGSPVLTACVAFVVGGIVSWWVVGPGSISGVVFVFGLALAVAMWGFIYQRKWDRRRTPDLAFDAARGVLTRLRPPPPLATAREIWTKQMIEWNRGPHTPVVLSIETIRGVEVVPERLVENDPEGGDVERTFFHIIAKMVDPAGPAFDCTLATMSKEANAHAFAAWVRATLGLA